MSGHTAPDELLLDYVTGALPPGPALAVSLHAALDATARRSVARLAALGGVLLDDEPAAAPLGAEGPGAEGLGAEGPGAEGLDAAALQRALARLDAAPVEPRPPPPRRPPGFEWAPAALLPHLAPGARWRPALAGFHELRLALAGDQHRVSLLRLAPGRGLPPHRHLGAEYTVVLQGGYSDLTGHYHVGDFAVGPEDTPHAPVAAPGPPCIALIVLERPILLTGRWGRWLNPLVRRGLV